MRLWLSLKALSDHKQKIIDIFEDLSSLVSRINFSYLIMARVTVEDCLEHVDSVFDLVKLASKRARRIANGADTLLEDDENDKPVVLALREIAEGLMDNTEFHTSENALEKEIAEELAKSLNEE